MGKEPRLSTQTIKVLGALLTGTTDELSGAEISRRTSLASGTLYPILARLEDAGWLQSRWEAGRATDLGRPRRRYYRVTAEGSKNVQALVRDLTPAAGRLAWS
jgi:DNA-binding PadR family transcriptional regulator